MNLTDQTSINQFIRFLLAGLVVTALNLGLFHLMANIWQMNYILANSIAYIICGLLDYFFNKYIVFCVDSQQHKDWLGLLKYFAISLVLLGMSNGLLYGLVESGIICVLGFAQKRSVELLLAKIITTVVISVVDYIAQKLLVFQVKSMVL